MKEGLRMDKLREISSYLDGLKIRKTLFGGYDKTDVEMKFGELLVLFKKCLEEEQSQQKKQIDEYETRLQTSQILINEMNKKLCSLMEEQKNAEKEKEKMKGAYKEYCSNILQQYSDSLRALSTEFSQILDNISNLQQNMIALDIFDEMEIRIEEKVTEVLPEPLADEE